MVEVVVMGVLYQFASGLSSGKKDLFLSSHEDQAEQFGVGHEHRRRGFLHRLKPLGGAVHLEGFDLLLASGQNHVPEDVTARDHGGPNVQRGVLEHALLVAPHGELVGGVDRDDLNNVSPDDRVHGGEILRDLNDPNVLVDRGGQEGGGDGDGGGGAHVCIVAGGGVRVKRWQEYF